MSGPQLAAAALCAGVALAHSWLDERYVLAGLLADAWLVRDARPSPGRHRLVDLLRAACERSEGW